MNPFMNTSTSSQIPSELHKLCKPCHGFFLVHVKSYVCYSRLQSPDFQGKAARAVQSTIEGLQWITKAPVLQALLFMFNFCAVWVVIWASTWIYFCKFSTSSYVKLHSFLACSCEAVSVREVRVNSRAAFNKFVIWASAVFCFSLCKSVTNSWGFFF